MTVIPFSKPRPIDERRGRDPWPVGLFILVVVSGALAFVGAVVVVEAAYHAIAVWVG